MGGGLGVCEGDGSAGEAGRKREEACEEGEEAEGAGVCIAACKFLASWCLAEDVSACLHKSGSPSSESMSLGVSVCL